MTREELGGLAVKWILNPPADRTQMPEREVFLEECIQRDGSAWYAIREHRFAWNHEDETWEYEPNPSSRTDEFLRRCRYRCIEAALDDVEKALGTR